MAGPVEYLDLIVDVFDNTGQRARVKKALTAGELIGEILREFDDLDQKTPEAYALFLRGEEKPLERGLSMEQLFIQDHDELVFKHAMPSERQSSAGGSKQYYLLDVLTRARYEIRWQPAIIGRPDNNPSHNELLAINLQNSPGGMSISRRHAQVTFEGEQYFLEALSATNPTFLNDAPLPVQSKAAPSPGRPYFPGFEPHRAGVHCRRFHSQSPRYGGWPPGWRWWFRQASKPEACSRFPKRRLPWDARTAT